MSTQNATPDPLPSPQHRRIQARRKKRSLFILPNQRTKETPPPPCIGPRQRLSAATRAPKARRKDRSALKCRAYRACVGDRPSGRARRRAEARGERDGGAVSASPTPPWLPPCTKSQPPVTWPSDRSRSRWRSSGMAMPGRGEGWQGRAVAAFAFRERQTERGGRGRRSESPEGLAPPFSLSLPRDQVSAPFPLLAAPLSAGSRSDARHSTCGGRTSLPGPVRRAARRTRDGRRTRAPAAIRATARCRRRRRRPLLLFRKTAQVSKQNTSLPHFPKPCKPPQQASLRSPTLDPSRGTLCSPLCTQPPPLDRLVEAGACNPRRLLAGGGPRPRSPRQRPLRKPRARG